MTSIIEHCGECGRPNKQYKRKITLGMLQFLFNLYKLNQKSPQVEFWHYRDVIKNKSGGLDYSLLEKFNLLERKSASASKTISNGMWRLTKLSFDFIEGKVPVPKFLYIKLGDIVRVSDEKIFIDQVSKKRFSIEELLNEKVDEEENG